MRRMLTFFSEAQLFYFFGICTLISAVHLNVFEETEESEQTIGSLFEKVRWLNFSW